MVSMLAILLEIGNSCSLCQQTPSRMSSNGYKKSIVMHRRGLTNCLWATSQIWRARRLWSTVLPRLVNMLLLRLVALSESVFRNLRNNFPSPSWRHPLRMPPMLNRHSWQWPNRSKTGKLYATNNSQNLDTLVQSRMGSTSTPSGAAKSSTVTPGQSVQQQQSGGCC